MTRSDLQPYRPDPQVPWPVRMLAVGVVLPFRLAWELLKAVGRVIVRFLLRPLAWLIDRLLVAPLTFLWQRVLAPPLDWIWNRVLAPVFRWIWRHLVVLPATGLWRGLRRLLHLIGRLALALYRLLAPVIEAVGRALRDWVLRPLVWLLRRFHQYVLRPGWLGAGWLLGLVYRYTLRPLGLAVRWSWRRTVVPVGRAVRAAGRWTNETVFRPAAQTVREILGMFRSA